jgi:hypothetical protein
MLSHCLISTMDMGAPNCLYARHIEIGHLIFLLMSPDMPRPSLLLERYTMCCTQDCSLTMSDHYTLTQLNPLR